jgi:putative ABC transport system ATP-binding protein
MLEFRDLDLTIRNRKIFHNYNLKIAAGEKIIFSAASGKGKTTLFRTLLGFQTPDKGKILLNGTELNAGSVKDFRSNMAYLSQDIDLPRIKFTEILDELYCYELNKHLIRDNSEINLLLDKFQLGEEYLHKKIAELSGGERQRIGLILCILLHRPVWLLDEPTSALDDDMKKQISEYILTRKETILIISHDKQWFESDKLRIERW